MTSTIVDWKYIAGFFDGEGSVTRNAAGYRISIPQTHRGVLEKIRRCVGFGRVVRVAKRQKHWKESWVFSVSRQREVLAFLISVEPQLVVKRVVVRNARKKLFPRVQEIEHHRKVAIWRRKKINKLRHRGLSYRAIGQRLGLDFGYVRRVFLRGI